MHGKNESQRRYDAKKSLDLFLSEILWRSWLEDGIDYSVQYPSVFTISDARYDFSEKKKWFKLRYDLARRQQANVKDILLRNGETEKEIDEAYGIVFNYYNNLVSITEKELKQTHEQEIVHRIITIGEK